MCVVIPWFSLSAVPKLLEIKDPDAQALCIIFFFLADSKYSLMLALSSQNDRFLDMCADGWNQCLRCE